MAPSAPGADPLGEAQRFKRWLRPVMGIVALGFVVFAARDVALRWGESEVSLDPWLAALSCAPVLLSCVAQGVAWILLAEKMSSHRLPRLSALSLYLFSQLARYTPGKVGLPLVRMAGAARVGLTASLVGVSVLVESVSWTATGGLLGFAVLTCVLSNAGLPAMFGSLAAIGLVGSGILLLLLLWVDRARLPAPVRRLFAPDGEGPIVPLAVPAAQLAYWALIACHGYLLCRALGMGPDAAMAGMGLYVIGGVAGFVVLAAPAGLGVREAVIVAGLTPLGGAAGAVGAVIISRAASLLADVLIWGVVHALSSSERSAGPSS
jgi:uncharacterized membrane protein YbhN (UPF0104 family)